MCTLKTVRFKIALREKNIAQFVITYLKKRGTYLPLKNVNVNLYICIKNTKLKKFISPIL